MSVTLCSRCGDQSRHRDVFRNGIVDSPCCGKSGCCGEGAEGWKVVPETKTGPNHQHVGECGTGDCYVCDAVRRYCSRPPEQMPLPSKVNVFEPDTGADDVRRRIVETCDGIRDLLLAKNEKYGNSALEPRRIFSKASNVEQILVRIDDKLSRIATMGVDAQADEDTVKDLIGYLVLLLIARK